MSGQPAGEKTEEATPQRQKKLREDGSVAKSQELPQAVALVVATALAPLLAVRVGEVLLAGTRRGLSGATGTDLGEALGLLGGLLRGTTTGVALLVVLVALGGIVSGAAITRSGPNLAMVKPKWQKVSPKAKLKQMLGVQAVFEGAKAFGKLAALAVVLLVVWRGRVAELLGAATAPQVMLAVVGGAVLALLIGTSVVAVLVGVADAAWARRRFRKQSRMTKQEVRDDAKQTEGDPYLKAARRSKQHALSRNRMIASVATADVVLANPTHVAVALTYAEGSPAPTVVARGAGVVAQKIKEAAKEAKVPVVVDVPLARALHKATQVGDPVPVELWSAVAQVLAVVYRRRPRRPARASVPQQRRGGTTGRRRSPRRTA